MNLTKVNPFSKFSKVKVSPGIVFAGIIMTALFAFEMFNYSTTDYALRDLLGELRFANIRWATILSIAFCGIDFAGIARLFTPEQGKNEPKEVWYLFGAWMLAATMNAMLTWWGVSMAIVNHDVQSTSVVDQQTLVQVVPIFVAIMVWVIRILIIGTISVAGEKLLKGNNTNKSGNRQQTVQKSHRPVRSNNGSRPSAQPSFSSVNEPVGSRPEPSYHNLSMKESNQSSRTARRM